MEQTKYSKRYLTRVVVEAATPLAVGTGDKDVLTDALVARDLNGLPFIPGSSIAGVLRHSIGDNNDKNSIFGFQEGDNGRGSRIIFTDAVLLDADGEAQDGLKTSEKSDFLSHYDALPIRQHVRINALGSTNKGSKFDEQVVYQGSRFVFEMEMVDNGDNESRYLEVLDNIHSQLFRLGGKIRRTSRAGRLRQRWTLTSRCRTASTRCISWKSGASVPSGTVLTGPTIQKKSTTM